METNTREIFDYAKSVPLFATLSDSDIETICSVMEMRKFRKDEEIIREDDKQVQTFFIIVDGTAYVSLDTSDGNRSILATLRPGDFFGEMSILDGQPRSASVISADHSVLFLLNRRDFLDILQRYPKISIQMLIEMSHRLRKSNRQNNALSLMPVYGRVAEVILRLAKEQGVKSNNLVIIPNRPTHQVMAEMAGTSRETVSRLLSQLQKTKCISIDGKKLIILDEKKLYD